VGALKALRSAKPEPRSPQVYSYSRAFQPAARQSPCSTKRAIAYSLVDITAGTPPFTGRACLGLEKNGLPVRLGGNVQPPVWLKLTALWAADVKEMEPEQAHRRPLCLYWQTW